jgi:acetyl esterase/lipase
MGVSRGSEAAELAATHFSEDFLATIVVVPTHLADGGAIGPDAKDGDSAWSIHGQPVPAYSYAVDEKKAAQAAAEPPGYNETADMLGAWNDPIINGKYAIPVERMTGPLLVLAAGADDLWPSWLSAERIRQRFDAHGKSDRVEVHVYPGAGHPIFRLGRGGPAASFYFQPGFGFIAFGGLPNETCEASFDSFYRILDFLHRRTGR